MSTNEFTEFFPEHAALKEQARKTTVAMQLRGARWLTMGRQVIIGLPGRRTKALPAELSQAVHELYRAGELFQLLPRVGRNGIPVITPFSVRGAA